MLLLPWLRQGNATSARPFRFLPGRRFSRLACAAVTLRSPGGSKYRRRYCTLPSGSDRELRLRLRPEAATLSDAWLRLTARFGDVDPTTIEIEIREGVPEAPATGAPADQRTSLSVPCW